MDFLQDQKVNPQYRTFLQSQHCALGCMSKALEIGESSAFHFFKCSKTLGSCNYKEALLVDKGTWLGCKFEILLATSPSAFSFQK